MSAKAKSREKLLEELAKLRRQVAELESELAPLQPAETPVAPFQKNHGNSLSEFSQTVDRQYISGMPDALEKYRLVFDSAEVGLVIGRANGAFELANRTFCHMLGYSVDELRELNVKEVTYHEDFQATIDVLARLKQEIVLSLTIEKRYVRKDMSLLEASTTVNGIYDENGQLEYIVATITDVAGAKAAKLAIQQSEEKYRTLFENVYDVIFVYDYVAEKVVSVNPQNLIFFGITEEQALSLHPFTFVADEQPDGTSGLECFASNVMQIRNEGSAHFEIRCRHLDGREFDASINAALMSPPNSHLMVCILNDITERKRNERTLREIAASISAATGDTFFQKVVKYLVEKLDIDCAFIGEVDTENHNLIQTVSVFCHGEIKNNFSYRLDISPCREVVGKKPCWFPKNVAKLFPEDQMLTDLNIESYLGIPLFDSKQQPLGLLAIMDSDEMNEAKHVQSIMQIFAGRMSAELERKQSEKALRDSEQRHRMIYDLAKVAFFDIDMTEMELAFRRLREAGVTSLTEYVGEDIEQAVKFINYLKVVDVNREALVVFEAESVEEFISKLPMIYYRDSIWRVLSILEHFFAGNTTYEGENVHRTLKGNHIHVLNRIVCLPPRGDTRKMIISNMEIGELRQAQEAQQRLVTAVETAVEGISILNANQEYIYMNLAHAKIFGYDSPDELIGKTWREIYSPEQVARFEKELVPVLFKVGAWQGQLETRRRDGTKFIQDISLKVLPDYGMVCVCRDATPRIEAEKKRQDLERQILHVQKLKSLGILAGGIAHDFNNLLTGILGNTELLEMDLPETSLGRENLKDIKKMTLRAAELCNQMLAYAGKGTFVIKNMNINHVINELTHLLGTAIAKKGTIVKDLDPLLPPIKGDAAQIKQIIMNLITNAAEAIEDNDGEIGITTGQMHCSSAYLEETLFHEDATEGQYIFMEVKDNGSGMDEATRKRIFDPFFTTKFTGRGLGLATVLGIVRGHRGALRLDSEPGKGTTMRVLFPFQALEDTQEAENDVAAENWQGSGKILIVDDEESVRTLGQRVLSRAGFETLLAEDGRKAIKIFKEHSDEISLVLLDMTMPYLNGLETYDQLRKVRKDIRTILCSGYNEQEIAGHELAEGLAGFIKKPFRVESLIETIREVLTEKSGD